MVIVSMVVMGAAIPSGVARPELPFQEKQIYECVFSGRFRSEADGIGSQELSVGLNQLSTHLSKKSGGPGSGTKPPAERSQSRAVATNRSIVN